VRNVQVQIKCKKLLCRKWSKNLGDKWKKGIPIEVLPVAYKVTEKELRRQLGGEVSVREGTAKVVKGL
jgi:ribose 5-phosphate isomerase A